MYGLTELHREQIRSARLVANPGCYPTTVQLPLCPLLQVRSAHCSQQSLLLLPRWCFSELLVCACDATAPQTHASAARLARLAHAEVLTEIAATAGHGAKPSLPEGPRCRQG